MTEISVNYDNVFRNAARLRQIGEEHRRAADALDAQRAAVLAAWKDSAGATYGSAAGQLAGQMRATANRLIALAAEIRRAAEQYQATEEANARAAKGLGGW